MKPIPVVFHLGPLQIHTYGIGLAITFYVAYRYFVARLRTRGLPTEWVSTMFVWVIGSAIVGARLLHVLTNWSLYRDTPLDVFAIWHGGLSSFGGLLLAVPTALLVAHRRCPELGITRGLDIVAPVLMAAWAMGRLLGPQLMVGGGGHPTTAWYGMAYAGEVGRRVPVPVIQAAEDAAVFLLLLLLERRLEHWPDGRPRVGFPPGIVTATTMILWGIERSLDEHFLLGDGASLGSVLVQVAGILLISGGAALMVVTVLRWRTWLQAQALAARAPVPVQPGGRALEDLT